ncbi:MAG: hypothetical protein RBS53_10595 [Bacteroidales bacterium]|jgi:hypothetical protein|nr:hypothetical protein [Bacteroidales bacterium]NLM91878.1 hypothetical protein [Bacteroidales bacterium]
MQSFSPSVFPRIILLSALILLLFSGCKKQEYEDRIVGVWEVVNVADIDPGQGEVWEFFDNNIDVFRYPIGDYENRYLYDNGKYVVERKGLTMYLKLANLKNSTFNTSWDIFKLDRDNLIISIEVPGGIFYKEFVKKSGN